VFVFLSVCVLISAVENCVGVGRVLLSSIDEDWDGINTKIKGLFMSVEIDVFLSNVLDFCFSCLFILFDFVVSVSSS